MRKEPSFWELVGGFALLALVGAVVSRSLGWRIDGLPHPAKTPEERLNEGLGAVNQARERSGLPPLELRQRKP